LLSVKTTAGLGRRQNELKPRLNGPASSQRIAYALIDSNEVLGDTIETGKMFDLESRRIR
jgi:hypothetical protein